LELSPSSSLKHDDYVKHEFSFQWTRLSKMLLEKERSEKNVYENIIEFGITNFEKSSSGVNKANEIITNIYTDLSEKCIKKNTFFSESSFSSNIFESLVH
jgi:hypothetical protein